MKIHVNNLTQPEENFLTRREKIENLTFLGEIFQIHTQTINGWPDPGQKFWPRPITIKDTLKNRVQRVWLPKSEKSLLGKPILTGPRLWVLEKTIGVDFESDSVTWKFDLRLLPLGLARWKAGTPEWWWSIASSAWRIFFFTLSVNWFQIDTTFQLFCKPYYHISSHLINWWCWCLVRNTDNTFLGIVSGQSSFSLWFFPIHLS